jgi:hypothetical protein
LRQTYGERFLPDQKGNVFASEFHNREKVSAKDRALRISLSGIDVIIYLPITEKFAAAKFPIA